MLSVAVNLPVLYHATLVTAQMLCISCLIWQPVLLVRRVHLSWGQSQSDVAGANNSTSVVSATSNQPSPEFLATKVQAVKQALTAEQVPVLQANCPGNSGLTDCAVNSSMTSCSLGGVSSQTLGLQALALQTMDSGFSSQLSVAQLPLSSGRPAFVLPAIASTFVPLTSALVSSHTNASLAVRLQAGLVTLVFFWPSFSLD